MQDHVQYLNELRRRSYTLRRSPKTGHVKIYDPHGCLVTVHSGGGGSDRRALANLKGDIRRHELRCPSSAAAHQKNDQDDDENKNHGSDADIHQALPR